MPVVAKREDLPDLQNNKDIRGKHIERVGVSNVVVPLRIARKSNDGISPVVQASVSLYTAVEHDLKGANMSRFIETLMTFANDTVSSKTIETMTTMLLSRLESSDAYVRIGFKYFLPRLAPVSKSAAIQGYDCMFVGRQIGDKYTFGIEATVIGTNLCPCSKEISQYGAHNQRNHIHVKLIPNQQMFWLEDLITLLENQMSCPIFPLLKREDEKWVTEKAYENPKFVEDIARDTALALDELGIEQYHIRSTADESIHHHEAEAILTKDWKLS